jgi:hypothetical protein
MMSNTSASSAPEGPWPSERRSSTQLRLVFGAEVDAEPEGADAEPFEADPTLAPEGAAGVVSLAAYILGLGVGDSCFCCGGELTHSPSTGFTADLENRGTEPASTERALECRRCGAKVTGP